jgi:site-specific DNA recombinase
MLYPWSVGNDRAAGIYVRISDDSAGLALGVERQRQDTLSLATSKGWDVVEVYSDNDVSASRNMRRPEYERMLGDIEAGRIQAIVVWDIDRLTRRPSELEHIIDLADKHQVSLASVGGEIDLATPQGRLTARIKGAVAKHEVEQASRRIRRKFDEKAQAGSPHGRVAYGWRREQVLDEYGRQIDSRDVLDPEQAGVIRECANRVLAGESLHSIARDLNKRTLRTPNGGPWSPVQVRQMLIRERNVGKRRHRGAVIGKAAWEPALDPDTFDRVVAILNDPTRRANATGRATTALLTVVARCGRCGGPMRTVPGRSTQMYDCRDCHKVSRAAADVDRLVVAVVTGRLALPDAIEMFSTRPNGAAVAAFHSRAEVVRARLDSAADSYAAGEIDGPQLARISARLRPELDELESQIRRSLPSRGISDLADLASPDIAKMWELLPLSRRRAVIDLLLSIRILPVGKGANRRGFDPSGVELVWKSGPDAGCRVLRAV